MPRGCALLERRLMLKEQHGLRLRIGQKGSDRFQGHSILPEEGPQSPHLLALRTGPRRTKDSR